MNRILGTQVLQATDRRMRVSIGDILTYGAVETRAQLMDLCRAVYQPMNFDRLIHARLDATHGQATVFSWLFRNMTVSIAEAVHDRLADDHAYLGAMDVDFSRPLHLRFFRLSLVEEYLLDRGQCWIGYSMGENEDPDSVVREGFERHGFKVSYEDTGARNTI